MLYLFYSRILFQFSVFLVFNQVYCSIFVSYVQQDNQM